MSTALWEWACGWHGLMSAVPVLLALAWYGVWQLIIHFESTSHARAQQDLRCTPSVHSIPSMAEPATINFMTLTFLSNYKLWNCQTNRQICLQCIELAGWRHRLPAKKKHSQRLRRFWVSLSSTDQTIFSATANRSFSWLCDWSSSHKTNAEKIPQDMYVISGFFLWMHINTAQLSSSMHIAV